VWPRVSEQILNGLPELNQGQLKQPALGEPSSLEAER